MKVTVEISDPLFRRASEFARRREISLSGVFEQGLEAVLTEARPAAPRFRLKTVTTKGAGLICENEWSKIRSLIYEGRGGEL
ncbi:MAG: DUF2191 domain-containing protein [Acidobacteria bacterium]|nr:DUF2191 domain-containing protein [Acidobacteriota bacterium]